MDRQRSRKGSTHALMAHDQAPASGGCVSKHLAQTWPLPGNGVKVQVLFTQKGLVSWRESESLLRLNTCIQRHQRRITTLCKRGSKTQKTHNSFTYFSINRPVNRKFSKTFFDFLYDVFLWQGPITSNDITHKI